MNTLSRIGTLVAGIGIAISAFAAAPAAQQPPTDALAAARAARWAYQPVRRPEIPAVGLQSWVRTPIDAFVLAKLEEQGLKPSPDADRASYARRAWLDVVGIIPPPEAVEAFVEDRSPDAYEKFIDGLLSTEHYGERQARRWLDLARYADTTGYSDDEQRPGMWRYRDYVIQAFNEDKPYDQFIREQVAGDELAPGSQAMRIATGFLRSYPDAPDHRDLVLKRYQSITDMTDTVGTVFLGQTLECARCHNHKSDPISQKDYFSLQAFFANSVPSDDLPLTELDEPARRYRADLARWERATAPARAAIAEYVKPFHAGIMQYARERFYEDGRKSLDKPEAEWNSVDRWINYRFRQFIVRNNYDYAYDVNYQGLANAYFKNVVDTDLVDPNVSEELKARHKSEREQYQALVREFKRFDDLKPVQGFTVISGITELGPADASTVQHVFMGGNHLRPLEEVQPAFPKAITPEATTPRIVPTATSSGRRTALANWIASDRNPLTARVFVNRVWAQLFGEGLVKSVSNFGKSGARPTHPELLDWLAHDFVHQQQWSVKKLQRQILLSSVYRQSSSHREDAFAVDPENRLLALYPRKRLDAEQIRDSLLAASGLLVEKVGGPSVYPQIPDAVMKQSTRRVPGFWVTSKDPADQNRRSLYVYTRRSVPYPMLEAFDMASPQLAHSRRDVTTTPQQSLTLFNNDLVYQWSHSLAARVTREAGPNTNARLDRLFRILYARGPDREERKLLIAFLRDQEKLLGEQLAAAEAGGEGATKVSAPSPGARLRESAREKAFIDLAHTLANANEFVYRY
jgi:hypothetical protein